MANKKSHPYHVVDPSPWPLIASIALFIFAGGAIMALHKMDHSKYVFGAGILAILYTMYGWWRDVIKEAREDGAHNKVVQRSHRMGMACFILSEVMFFAVFFWAYFDSAIGPGFMAEDNIWEIVSGTWPPAGIETFDPWHLPLFNTLILLLSGTTVTWAHYSLMENNQRDLVRGLALTVFLGICFTITQALEYGHAAFGLTDGIYSSTFYLATGFHGLHVIIGTIFLAVCLVRAKKGHFTEENHLGFEFAAWYWHFVDVVWLFLFVFVYIWGS